MDSRPGRVTVIGEALIDMVADGTGATYAAHPGGSPYNVAIGLARLDLPTSLMARLGHTTFGRILRRRAEDAGVDLTAAAAATEPATLAVVSIDEQAQAIYDFYVQGTADWQWTREETSALPSDTAVLHFGSIASWTPPGDAAILGLARRVRDAGGLVSYDPNVRAALLESAAVARPRIEAAVAAAHLVKASAEDLAWLYPGEQLEAVGQRWLDAGALTVVVTDGPHGAVGRAADGTWVRYPGRAVEVVDTVGAGDSFMSALLASLLRRGVRTPRALAALDPTGLGAAVDDAVTASSITCQRAGADPPTQAELDLLRS